MKTISLLSFLFFSINLFSQQELLTLNYETDKSQLNSEHIFQLDFFLKKIPLQSIQKINIVGHTDTVANQIYNQNLSKKRATNVQKYFLSKGIDSNLIQLSWLGETQANSPKNLIEDRKVVVEIFWFSKPLEQVSIEKEKEVIPESEIIETSVAELFEQLKPELQEFCINPKKDTIIRCENGSIINIPANAFKLSRAQSRSKSCLKFQVREVFYYSDMVLENLTTTSNGEILETQGMIYTNAILDDDTLSLQKEIAIMLPTDEIKDDVRVFDGTRDLHSDVMNWAVNNNSVLRNFNVLELDNCLKYNDLWKECNGFNKQIKINQDQTAECFRTLLYCGFQKKCTQCKFLFCRVKRIGKPVRGIFNKSIRKQNKEFRQCTRATNRLKKYLKFRKPKFLRLFCGAMRNRVRGSVLNGNELPNEQEEKILELTELIEQSDSLIQAGLVDNQLLRRCDELDQLFKEYQVTNIDDLVYAVNRPLMEEFGVKTVEALLDTLPKVNLDNIEVAYRNKTISFDDYKFYIFNTSNFGWKNLDIFTKLSKDEITKITIDIKPSREVDCKLIIRERSFVLPGQLANDHFYFDGIPKNETAWIVAIKYENGQPMLAMKKITIEKGNYKVDFEKLTLDELKEKLSILNFE